MADKSKKTDGPSPFSSPAYDYTLLPDYDNDFINEDDMREFAKALAAPEHSPSQDDLTDPTSTQSKFITALNDWRPVRQRVRRKRKRAPRRGKDETREGFVYGLLKWPLLFMVFGWLLGLCVTYLFTRLYIYLYEQFVTWRGRREMLRKSLRSKETYEDWVSAAKELDTYLGNDKWKKEDDYAYYNSKTLRKVKEQMEHWRKLAEAEEARQPSTSSTNRPIDELRGLLEACVKNNFVGFENPRLYSETYYGTKDLVQEFIDEAETSMGLIMRSEQLDNESKRSLFKHMHTNFGRTALCLSGGATFAYYHFGVAKALMDADLLPHVITGTSGGALVAALLATRTDEELKKLLVPALAHRITACHDSVATWAKRWYRTGARFDSVDWARQCGWFTRGSMTFREAYERTGRILNVSCVPSDPHSPTILANYLTSPDCVIWSAVLASAAVPGILNPVVLMKRSKDGTLAPYSFGNKWKDGSLRTDIPLKSLNLHFNVRFSIVSQVNPHINLFFFSSRGSVGLPVTHRRGRGWRGGFLGSATEQYIKLDLTKWLKVLRHLELLPRPMGQDWSEIWLQRFSGTITLWPKSIPSDYIHILSDPSMSRLARMIHVGQQSTFPKLKFIANRMKLERAIDAGRRAARADQSKNDGTGLLRILSDDDLAALGEESMNGDVLRNRFPPSPTSTTASPRHRSPMPGSRSRPSNKHLPAPIQTESLKASGREDSPSLGKRLSGWWSSLSPSTSSANVARRRHTKNNPYLTDSSSRAARPVSMFEFGGSGEGEGDTGRDLYERAQEMPAHRRGSWVTELERQSSIFFDDDVGQSATDEDEGTVSDVDAEEEQEEAPLEEYGNDFPGGGGGEEEVYDEGFIEDQDVRESIESYEDGDDSDNGYEGASGGRGGTVVG